MPYIKRSDREKFPEIEVVPTTAGELNYCITKLILAYVGSKSHYSQVYDQSFMAYVDRKSHSYQTFNDALGALEGAKMELYRRWVAPYEDNKIEENGDIPLIGKGK